MPELPEVETIKNDLGPQIVGKRIRSIELLWEGMVKDPSPDEFRRRVAGQLITSLDRRGKYLLMRLGSGDTLIIHLRMTGALLVSPEDSRVPDYVRAIVRLDDGNVIFFRDPRKFGVMRVVADSETVVGKLGPEPLEPGFTPALLGELLHKRKAPIKAVLCDQEVIAGVGNMYADEALFAARIRPTRAASSLTGPEVRRLHKATRDTLQLAILNKGASTRDYCRPDGSKGSRPL